MNSETSPVTPLQAVDEREAMRVRFEAYMAGQHPALRFDRFGDPLSEDFGEYTSLLAHTHWRTWQAASLPARIEVDAEQQDSSHFAAPQTEAKSLQPLLIAAAEKYADNYEGQDIPARDIRASIQNAFFAGNEWGRQNRTPARQEERPDGEQAKNAARYEWLRNKAVWTSGDGGQMPWCVLGITCDDCRPCDGEELDEAIDAALRASSAPTTKQGD